MGTLCPPYACIFQCVSAQAAATNVDVGAPLTRFSLLKPGAHHYLRYPRMPDGANAPLDIRTREVRFEERDGKPALHIVQRWEGVRQQSAMRDGKVLVKTLID